MRELRKYETAQGPRGANGDNEEVLFGERTDEPFPKMMKERGPPMKTAPVKEQIDSKGNLCCIPPNGTESPQSKAESENKPERKKQ